MADDLKIGITAELANFRAAMAQLPGIGESEARDMVKGIQRQLKEAEKAAKASAKQMGDDVGGGLEKAADSAGFLKDKFKETFGTAGELITDFLAPLGEASTGLGGMAGGALAVGTGIAAAAAGTAAYVAGVKALVDSSLEARDRLIEQGRAAEIPPEALESLKLYEQASDELSTAMDKLTVMVGGELADDLAVLVHTASEWVDWAGQAVDTTSGWVRSLQALVSLGLSEKLYEYRDSLYEVAEAEIKAADEAKRWREESEQMLIMLGLLEEESKPAVKATEKRTEAIDEEKAALEDMLATARSVQAWDAQRAAAAEQEAAALEEDRLAYLQYWRDRQAWTRETTAIESEESQKRIDERRQEIEQARADQKAALEATVGAINTLLSSFEQMSAGTVAYYEKLAAEREAVGKELTEEEKRAAMKAWNTQKALAEAQIIIQGVQMGVSFVNALAPVLGPAAIIPALAASSAFIAAQISLVKSQPPPEFPMGLSPDHRMVGLQDEELVATRRASRMPEVRDAVRRGNRGERPAPRESSEVEVRVSLDPRLRRLRVDTGRVGKKPFRRRG